MDTMNRRAFVRVTAMGSLAWGAARGRQDSSRRKPNIILILVDDLGWAEPGCYGNRFNETPNLDRLAAQGMRFTEATAAAPVCSPTRASVLTGQYPARIGITDYLRPDDANHLPTGVGTLAEQFKEAGYATGIIGKWHLTGYANHGAEEFPPDRFGFDEVIVSENRGIGAGSYFHPYHFNREIRKRLPGEEHLIDRCNLEAVEFIERHRNQPFFLYLSHYAVHTRLQGKAGLVQKYENKPDGGKGETANRNNPHLAAQLESVDQGVGMVLDTLRKSGVDQNTLILFAGDNGGESRVTSNAPLRGGKSQLYEGGIRVPLVVHWPGRVKAGKACGFPVSSIDWHPTLLEAAGLRPPPGQPVDGLSLIPLLDNPDKRLQRDALYWHYPLARPHFLGGRSSGAVRRGDWKLVAFYDTKELELYNLKRDGGEGTDCAGRYPERAKKLHERLMRWLDDVGAAEEE